MKKILLALFILISYTSFAQQQQSLGSTNTIVTAKYQLLADSALRGPLDTLSSAPIGSIAIKNGVQYNKTSLGWITVGSVTRNARADSIKVGSNEILDNDNPFNSGYYKASHAYSFPAFFTQARGGAVASNGNSPINSNGTKTFTVLGIGDSEMDDYWIYQAPFENLLGPKFVFSGPGLLTFGQGGNNNNIGIGGGGYAALNWTLNDQTAGGRGIDAYSLISTGSSGDLVYSQSPSLLTYNIWSTVRVFWYGKTGGGTFTISIDGGSATSVNTSSLTGVQYTDVAALTDATHSLTIHLSAQSTNGVELLGYKLSRATAGLQFNKAGHLGLKSTDYSGQDSATKVAEMKAISPNLVIINYTNDFAKSGDTAAYKAAIHKIVTWIKATDTLCSIIVVGPMNVDTAFWHALYKQTSYESQLRQLAIEDTIAVFFQSKLFGSFKNSYTRGVYIDSTHLNSFGGTELMSALLSPFAQTSIDPGTIPILQNIFDAQSAQKATLLKRDTLNMNGNDFVNDSVLNYYIKFGGKGVNTHETGTATQILGINRGGSDQYTVTGYNTYGLGGTFSVTNTGTVGMGANLTMNSTGTQAKVFIQNNGGNARFAGQSWTGDGTNILYGAIGINETGNLLGNNGVNNGASVDFDSRLTNPMRFNVNNAATNINAGNIFSNGNWTFGVNNQTDNSTARVQIMSTTAQLALHYDNTNRTIFTTGSTGIFTIAPTGGTTTATGNLTATSAIGVGASSFYTWGSGTTQPNVFSDANYTMNLRNGTNANELWAYNTFTDATHYEAGVFGFIQNSNILSIGTKTVGNTLRNTQFIGGTFGLGTAPVSGTELKVIAGTTTLAPIQQTSGTLNTTIQTGAIEYNNAHYVSNSGLNRVGIGGSIADFIADAGNTGSTETDLYTYTTKASTLAATGEKLKARFSGNVIGSATASRTIIVYFAGTVIFTSGAITVSSTGNFDINVSIIRTGSTTARAVVNATVDGVSLTSPITETDLTGLTFTNTNILKITGTSSGTGSATNDIVAKLGDIFWWPASNN